MLGIRDMIKKVVIKEMDEFGSVPLKVILVKENQIIPVFFSGLNKNELYQSLRELVKMENPDIVYIISESWAVSGKDENEIDLIVPSEHPERIEIVMIEELTPVGVCLMTAKIKESSGKRYIEEFEEFKSDYSNIGGPATEIFPDEKRMAIS